MSANNPTVSEHGHGGKSTVNEPATLSLANLDSLPEGVERPKQARGDLTAGILHFGPGNFHRAHQQVYLDALMNRGVAQDWAVVGASVMPGDTILREALLGQDLLGTVISQSAETSSARVTGAMIDYLPVNDPVSILAALSNPYIRIVSMTVTEGGYFVDAETGQFDAAQPAIVEDAANPQSPRTVFGLIVSALADRREKQLPAFTVMSCDNLPHNGVVARGAVVGLARLIDPELADWIDTNVSFPNGMVDRIAPATGAREHALVRDEHGIDDAAPVFCEDYLQWVLEDKFVAGRPPLEQVGVEFVADVTPFETMKISILNGGHALIAYPAALLGIEFAHEAMQDPDVAAFLDRVEQNEIIPIVPPVPGTDLNAYYDRVTTRFANPKIADTTRRLCFDGSNRQPKFILPSVRERLAVGGAVDGLALGSALWCRYCYGETDAGEMIRANDPAWDHLVGVSHEARTQPGAWLAMRDVYGSLSEDEIFSKAFAQALESLWRDGTRETLRRFVG